MGKLHGTLARAVARRLSERDAIAVSSFIVFSLFFLCGSVLSPALNARTQGVAAAGSMRSTEAGSSGGAQGGGAELAGESSAESRVDRGLYFSAYEVKRGDTLSGIADDFNVSLDTVVSFNGIKSARSLQPGTLLKIPSMSGILYTAKEGDSAAKVAAANGISCDRVIDANGLMSDSIDAGRVVFLPDAKLASFTLREISGDLFQWPARGWITSWYGWRSDPFTGARSFHNGLDIGVDLGTPVHAAMDGAVAETGYNSSYGNYVLVSHHAGWMSLYGHLQSISVKSGQRVAVGQVIAYSGNTGYSTGPHLHFSVFKNDRTVNPYNVLH
jgi:murein DD-endopeptidase MepM/ murein hydrolase activator NlpD